MSDELSKWTTSPAILRAVTAAIVGALVVWSAWQRWEVLAATPFPIGVDGYFYPIQVRSLIEHGTLVYPTSPLTFVWLAPFAIATDPIVGVKIGAAVGGALIAVPTYLVGARLGNGRGPGIVAASIAVMSAGSSYLSIEFIKQGIGLTVAMVALWLVLRVIEKRTGARWLAACAGILAALLTHKVAAVLVVIVSAPAVFANLRGTGALRGRRLLYFGVGASVALLLALILGISFPQRFLSVSDLALLSHALSSHARWDAPALVAPGLTLAFGHEASTGASVAIVAAALLTIERARGRHSTPGERGGAWAVISSRIGGYFPNHSPGERAAMWVLIALAIGIGMPWLAVTDPQGLAFRLRVAAFVPLAVCAAYVARVVLGKASEFVRDGSCVAIAALVGLYGTTVDRTEGQVLAHPALVAASLALEDQLPGNATVIVPERHIAFMIAWYTQAPVSLRPDPIATARRVRLLLPLSSANYGWHLEAAVEAARLAPDIASPIGLHPRHRNGFVLVTEPTWEWMLAQMPAREQHHFAAWPTI